MANSKKFQVNSGIITQTIDFVSPDKTRTITAVMYDDGSISFTGTNGELFTITDDMTGVIFSVNDISGIPSIEVDADGTIRLAETHGNLLIGTAIDDGVNKLQINGDATTNGLVVLNTGHVDTDHTTDTGVVNIEDSIISFVDATRTFSIAPAVDTFEILHQGTEYSFSTPQTVVIPNTIGTHFIYFLDGVLTTGMTPWDIMGAAAPIAITNWNGSSGAVGDERHGLRDLAWHDWAHHTVGTRYKSGLALVYPAGGGNDLRISIQGGTLKDEDITLNLSSQTRCRLWREASAGFITWVNSIDNGGFDYPVFWNSTTSRVQYNRLSDYSLQDTGVNDYVVYYIYGSNDIDRSTYVYTPAIATAYNRLTDAREAPVAPSFSAEIKLLYQLIYKGSGVLEEVTDYRTSSGLVGGGTQITTAAAVSFTPSGNIASTTVQAAIEELDSEKANAVASDIKSLYEQNPDTNAYTDAEKLKVSDAVTRTELADANDSVVVNGGYF